MDYMKRAEELYDKMVETRRHLHQHPELGYDIPETAKYIKEKLESFGIETHDFSQCGVTATVGPEGGKVVLLRADMDALPIKEQSGLDFASKKEGWSHACGHDMHPTMLLGAAKLLKENEANLKGQVKFIFQPAEELLTGGGTMVEDGILENPKVDVAMGLHVWPGAEETGIAKIAGPFMSSANNFRIRIKGVGSHGATPFLGVDPVYIGAQIVVGVPEVIARELPFNESAVITMGRFIGEGAINVVPGEVLIEGTARTFSNKTREYLKERLPQLVQQIAQAYRGEAELEFLSDCPVLINDPEFTAKAVGYLEELEEAGFVKLFDGEPLHGSEDFAFYANEVPSFFFLLNNPVEDKSRRRPVHHPEVIFDESVMPIGAAAFAHMATRWLEENS